MVCHHLSPSIPEDVAFRRIEYSRRNDCCGRHVLHDLGAISMMSSDSLAMGRIGEVITRTWQTADKMKRRSAGRCLEKNPEATIYACGVTSRNSRSIPRSLTESRMKSAQWKTGKLADSVLWKPAFFGVKPEMIVKGGMIAWSVMGDANASIPTPQPVIYRPMFGSYGNALHSTSLTFISRAAAGEAGIPGELGSEKDSRHREKLQCGLTKRNMIHNDALPRMEVDPDTYEVRADGVLLTCEPAQVLPMAQRYFIF